MANRLNLDWSLNTANERTSFVNEYITHPQFSKNPPSEEELETIANYVLWGKDDNGTNVVQRKEIELETRNATWTRKTPESLDALLETPTFNENLIIQNHTPAAKTTRIVFDRNEALASCPESLRAVFIDLFHQIDQLDLIINYYDLAHGKRKNPPRPELLNSFSPEEQALYKAKAEKLTQYRYLKMRHLLVELRRQQFTLKDTYSTPIQLEAPTPITEAPTAPTFDADIIVLPCGVASSQKTQTLIFTPIPKLIPESFTSNEIHQIIKNYWDRKNEAAISSPIRIFDFSDIEHVSNLFIQYFELEESAALNDVNSTTTSLLNALEYYIEIANLTEPQKDILHLKKLGYKNQDIADIVNKKHGKTYTANYISTIFRQKIVKQINEAAQYHERIVLSLPFPEEFKKCSTCGRPLLRDGHNFVKKTRAKDGFTGRCKVCDKLDRDRKKQQEN